MIFLFDPEKIKLTSTNFSMPQTHSQHFIPPLNFGLVEEELYRSGET